MKLTITIGTAFLLIASVLLAVFAEPMVALLSKDREVIALGTQILRIQCLSLPLLGFYAVSSMYMQNIGQYARALWISVARQGFFYLPLLFLLPQIGGQTGLFLVQPAADFLATVFAWIVIDRYAHRSSRDS